MKFIGLCGLKGSGKDTCADLISEIMDSKKYKCIKISYAYSLKQAICNIFGFEFDMINGTTPEYRKWREQPEKFWSEKLGYQITPRQIMQKIGTDLLRNQFDKNIWINSFLKNCEKIQKHSDKECIFLVPDCRFPNEIEFIENHDGKIIEVYREWPIDMSKISDLHESEISFINAAKNPIRIINNSTIENLKQNIIDKMKERSR